MITEGEKYKKQGNVGDNYIVLVQGLKEGLNGKDRELRDSLKLGAGKMEQ